MDNVDVRTTGLQDITNELDEWARDLEKRVDQAFKEVTVRWAIEAAMRAPVGEGGKKNTIPGLLRNTILREVERVAGGEAVGRVGSNRSYAAYVEFGTKWIAGGRVKALGTGPVTDSQAIKDWAAKAMSNAERETMPFFRSAWSAIEEWAVKKIEDALNPP